MKWNGMQRIEPSDDAPGILSFPGILENALGPEGGGRACIELEPYDYGFNILFLTLKIRPHTLPHIFK